jgi:hypothetical protein
MRRWHRSCSNEPIAQAVCRGNDVVPQKRVPKASFLLGIGRGDPYNPASKLGFLPVLSDSLLTCPPVTRYGCQPTLLVLRRGVCTLSSSESLLHEQCDI